MPADTSGSSPLRVAAALALGAAVSLGLARFSYALLLPLMRADLGWSYLTAGLMNTVNAGGYLIGALLMPRWLRRHDPRRLMLAGMGGAGVLLAAHGAVSSEGALFALRLLSGMASAAAFVCGGLLAARLGGGLPAGGRATAGLVLGLYYGGTGVGIVASAMLVPGLVAWGVPQAWRWAWAVLGALAVLSALVTARATRHLAAPAHAAAAASEAVRWSSFGFGLCAYFLFGLGYIGYMTFIVTLLHERGSSGAQIAGFYALLGVATMASSRIWADLLQRSRGGEALCLLNALLAVATVLPLWGGHPAAVFASATLFGGVFLSVVASTTALVRHNLPAAHWSRGISAFTTVFAAGQIVGPGLVGWVADGAGGIGRGLAVSAAVLAGSAVLAWGQKPLVTPPRAGAA